MRATLVHNPSAGHQSPSRKMLAGLLTDAGFEVCTPRTTRGPKLRAALREAGDVVVVAGGDGSVGQVVRAMAREPDVPRTPIAILPLGTANNLARSLGLDAPVEALVAGLVRARRVRLDGMRARWDGEETMVLEAAGAGFFPPVMLAAAARERADSKHLEDEDDELRRDLRLWCAGLLEAEPHPCRLTVDGIDRSGDYLLSAVLTGRAYGPGIELVRDADPADGWLDVAVVPAESRPALAAYLAARLDGDAAPPALPTYRGRRVVLDPCGGPVHLDDRILPHRWKPGRGGATPVALDVVPGAVEFLVPA
jgi:diacylglycerol kinase (ATP)